MKIQEMNKIDDQVDEAYEKFKVIRSEVEKISRQNWSESDTRLKVIDEILFDVLGWDKLEASTEERAGSGFTDYSLKIGNHTRAVIEAKKDEISFELANRYSGKAYKLNGAVFNQQAKLAIDQAVIYSAFKNCELAAVTNGNEWIIFRANRLGDGLDTLEGKGFIFNSLQGIEENFRLFFDLLSMPAAQTLKFRGEFQNAEGTPMRDLSFFRAARNPLTKKLLPRGEFANDFDALMSSFFERLKGDHDSEMIKQCFVVSKESEFADEKLLRIAEDLVEKVKHLDTGTGQELVDLIESAKLQHRNRFILLVGNKGAGKSTFVDRFFRFVLPPETTKEIVLVRVDLSLNAGDEKNIIDWLNKRMLEECEKAVFTQDSLDWDECIGKMFFDHYQRWSTGTMSHLYNSNKEQFKIEFGRHIEQIRETQPHEYIKRLIGFITKSNLKIPCLIFDNTDHYTISFQESVFQYARSIYESEFCVVILPITDKTSWQLSKQGALQSFESEVLYLPVPQPEKVIERRISYLLEKLNNDDEKSRQDYFLSRGIRLRLDHIASFAGSINKIFVESPDTARWIGGLSNQDIRRLLELTKDVIASPHLKLDDLLKAHLAGNLQAVPEHKIKSAIIKKRYDIYPVGEHSFVQNLYALVQDPPTSPLLGARILQFLRDAGQDYETENIEFVTVNSVQEYFANLSVHPHITLIWIEALVKTGLVLNYDPTILTLNGESLIEISPSGTVHLGWATLDTDYIQVMKDITQLRDKDVYEQLVSDYGDYKIKWKSSIKRFIEYLIAEDNIYCKVPVHSSFTGQEKIVKRLKWITEKRLSDEI